MLKNASNSARTKKILVVEDEEMFRRGVVKILQLEGYSTFEAGDGDEGLRTALDKNLDLIISDVHLPNMYLEKPFSLDTLVQAVKRILK